MRPIELDFVQSSRSFTPSGVVLLLLGVLAIAADFAAWRQIDSEASALLARTPQRGSERASSVPPGGNSESVRRQIQLAAEIIKRKAVPWDTLFRDIEAASGKDVGLLSIQPETAGAVLRIDAEARDVAAMVAYVNRLGQQSSLRDVVLVTHEFRGQGGLRAVRFGLSARWVQA
jgi:hypothetical protein